MIQLDLRKQLKPLYSPSTKKVEILEVPRLNFLMIDGAIEPGMTPGISTMFQENMQALYSGAYTLKFMLKQRKQDPIDYPVMASEGLWDVRDGHFDITVKDNWDYTLMILQPDVITQEIFADALAQMRKKKGAQPAFARLRLETWEEGLCLQIMHLGPYDTEPATVEKMHVFASENGYTPYGKHHEIYLGNPLRADPSKLKTILRHPIKQ